MTLIINTNNQIIIIIKTKIVSGNVRMESMECICASKLN